MGDGRSVKTLISIAESLPANLGLSAGMAGIRGAAESEGISLAVDVNGMLTELTVSEQAIALGARRLAAEITRLSSEARRSSVRQGLVALEWGCNPAVAAAIAEQVEPAEAESPPAKAVGRSGDEDEDFAEDRQLNRWESHRPSWGR